MNDNGLRTGTVKYFNGEYGFIQPDDGGPDVHFYKTVLMMFRIGMLYPGDRVAFKTSFAADDPGKELIRTIAMDDGGGDRQEARVIPARRGAEIAP